VRFTLDKDGVIEELHVYATVEPDTTGWKVTPTDAAKSIKSFDEDDDVIIADKAYFVNDDTIIIDEIDDIDLVKWDNIKEKSFTAGSVEAIIVADGLDAKLVIFTAGFDKIQKEDKELGVVLDKFRDEDGDWAATVVVYNGGKVDYKLDDKDEQFVGDIIIFTVDVDDELTVSDVVYGSKNETDLDVSGVVSDKKSSSIKIGGTEYKVNSKTLVFDVTDGLDDIEEAAYRDVRNGDKVVAVVENSLVKVIYIVE